ncbi:MAG: C40 family peptidase [Eggerthellaceae bacterium]|nr:C40 family peptidase [Eggerthellaceae bacterium]
MIYAVSRMGAKVAAIATVICAVALAAVIASPTPAFADDYESSEAALQALNNMMTRVDELSADYQAALDEKSAAELKAAEAKAAIDEKTAQIKDLQDQLCVRLRAMYRTDNATMIDVILGSTSFDDFVNNLDLLTDLNEKDAQMVSDLKTARTELEAAKAEYDEQLRIATEKAEEAERLLEEANGMAAEIQSQYQRLLADESTARMLTTRMMTANTAVVTGDGDLGANQYGGIYQETGGYEETYVPQDDIVAFDDNTGYATLSDGTTAKVVGYDSNTGNAIVDLAMSFVGGNYQYGAEDAGSSTFDCSGLVQYVYGQSGIEVGGHNDRAILNAGTVVDSSEAEAGDILWWDGHVAIYTGDGMMVSADNEEYGITYREVSDGATYVRY